MASSPRTRRLRWFAPLAVAAVIGFVAAVPNLASAAPPPLAPLSAQQLIAKVHQANVNALSGTIDLTANLGIPNLSALTDAAGGGRHGSAGFNPTSLLSGSHQALVWFDGPDRNRVALLQTMAETDVVHNGQSVWTWDSTSKKVDHYTLSATTSTGRQAEAKAVEPITTPEQMANDLLAQITPSTAVSVTTTDLVAKKAAYQLVLSPKSSESTVDRAVIAVEGSSGLPLRVQIFAKGQKKAAIELGFSSIDFSAPAASNFNFSPPPGSTVADKAVGRHDPATAPGKTPGNAPGTTPDETTPTDNGPVTVGQDWSTVAIFSNVTLPAQAGEFLRAGTPVSGGTLIGTPLVNVLVLNDGRIAVGAVNASALEAAVAAAH